MGLTTAQAFGETRSLLGTIKQQNQQKRTLYRKADKEALGQILRQVENLEERQTLRRYMRDHLGVYFQYAGGRKERSETRDALSLGNAVNLSQTHLHLKEFGQYADVVDWLSVYSSTSPYFFRKAKKWAMPRFKGLMLQNLPIDLFNKIPPCDILFLAYESYRCQGQTVPTHIALPDWFKTEPPKLIVFQSAGQGMDWDSPPSLNCDVLQLRMPIPGHGRFREYGASMSFKTSGHNHKETWEFAFVGPYPDYERTKMGAPEPEAFYLHQGNSVTFSQIRERYFPFVYRNRREASGAMTWRHALHLFT